MRQCRWLILAWSLVALPARAHVGAVVANARFTKPAPPPTTTADAGEILAPFTVDTADDINPAYTISWEDGDNDPTGRFYFYYLDHAPSFAVAPDQVETLATPIPDGAGGIWASCSCNPDAGVACPDAGVRDCRNMITWNINTGGVGGAPVPAGTYWIIAVNNDPPYHLYTVSFSPVRVTHGATPLPPAAMVLRPDGYGSFDSQYRVQWWAVGAPPLKIDLAYGIDDPMKVLGPTTSLAKNVMGPLNPDGTQSYDWDVSGLQSLSVYFLRVTVTDGNGVSTFTDSRFGLSVFHPSLDGGAPAGDDLGPRRDGFIDLKPPPGGCSMGGGGGVLGVLGPLALALAAAGAAWLLARRARSGRR